MSLIGFGLGASVEFFSSNSFKILLCLSAIFSPLAEMVFLMVMVVMGVVVVMVVVVVVMVVVVMVVVVMVVVVVC